MKQRLIDDGKNWYRRMWGNYKSDKHKSYRTLRCECDDLLRINLSKKQLIEIKDFIKEQHEI